MSYKDCEEEKFCESLWHLASDRLGFTSEPVLDSAWRRFAKTFSRRASGELETVMKEVCGGFRSQMLTESHGLFMAFPMICHPLRPLGGVDSSTDLYIDSQMAALKHGRSSSMRHAGLEGWYADDRHGAE